MQLIFWFLIAASLLLGFNIISHLKGPIGDEGVHSFQVVLFVKGTYEIYQYVTMIPIYHALNALLVKVAVGSNLEYLEKLNYLRFANMLLAASAIPAFLALVRYFNPGQAYSRTLCFVFIPFLFPLFFLIYTDLLSLAFTLAMVERTLRGKYKWAGLLALLAVMVRQPNLVWVGYCGLLVLLREEEFVLSKEFVLSYFSKVWPFAIVVAMFAVFVVVNGGVAVGDAEQHPVSFNPSNFYFFLLVSFAVFLPYTLARWRDVAAMLKAKPWVMALLIALFFVYLNTYQHPHKYNTKELSFYRHNLFIYYSCDIYWLRVSSYFAMAWMALSYWAAARIDKKHFVPLMLLLPFTLLAVVPMPLIEQRYYFVSLCLFMAMHPPIANKVTALTLAYYLLVAVYILYHVSRTIFFL
ncbi:MAG: Dol-P-Glc:Glc(2)Man(9)GlcNAc(2)-PP-Dol alpha-1,2-glucosyltransferase [Cellvibrionaceae bacterium]|nr:Dol-P-Glc:Glc(2)Man(9)GlcNAc(2)-PP-Dol alpha-1,2-glucosyltransferase [Cellvibrionaceae bacterium]